MTAPDGIEIRRAVEADAPAVLELLATSLGWDADVRFERFFRWKHDENPFGPSARWVACDDGRVVGFRALLRWELARAGNVLRAVRTVDTATAPEARGRGVFRALTLHALEELRREGVDLVFNTPNTRSGPGYLAMGWEAVGHVRRRARARSLTDLVRMVGARGGGTDDRWSEPSVIGVSAGAVLGDAEGVRALLASQPPREQLHTRVTPEYLAWRYDGAIPARAVVLDGTVSSGVAFVRVRRRGSARVAVLGDVLAPEGDIAAARRLARTVASTVDAVATVALGRELGARDGFLPIAGAGPLLVTRALASVPPTSLDDWALGYGDLELF